MPLTLFPWSRGISPFCLFSTDFQSASHMAPAPWSQPRILHWVFSHLPSQFEPDLVSLSLHWPASTLHHCCLCPSLSTLLLLLLLLFSHSLMSDSLWPHGLPHTRLPCPSPSPGACSNWCSLSWWCHPTILPSVIPFSSCFMAPKKEKKNPVIHHYFFHVVTETF